MDELCVCVQEQAVRPLRHEFHRFYLLPDSAHVPAGGHRDSGILRTIVTLLLGILLFFLASLWPAQSTHSQRGLQATPSGGILVIYPISPLPEQSAARCLLPFPRLVVFPSFPPLAAPHD